MRPSAEKELGEVQRRLREEGVAGVDDIGRFVNNTTYFAPSRFDAAAAAPILVELLPGLSEPKVVEIVGRHLQQKGVPRTHYDAVLVAFERWAPQRPETGWVLGDALARLADKSKAGDFLDLAVREEYGTARAFIVDALWRFKSVADVVPVLQRLIRDRDVSLYAMTALQRTIGREGMATELRELIDTVDDTRVLEHAQRQLKRIEKKLAS